jgi:outer membrane lipoprotein-sorting protein
MRMATRTLLAISAAFLFSPPAVMRADDLHSVLKKLDEAATRFKSTSADFTFNSLTTEPIPDQDVQTGTVYYDRKDGSFQMGIHIETDNGRPAPKVVVISGGLFKMYDQPMDQVTTSNKASKYESYLVLGFGASGKDLAQKWNITYLGTDSINGVKVDKLELVAKDPEVLKMFPKVTIWIDPERGVSLKQVFDEGEGQSRICTYGNFKMNASLPGDAFTFKTDSKTQYIAR